MKHRHVKTRRPALARSLTTNEFFRWYWLKSELATFCRELGLPASGAKEDLSARIHDMLAGRSTIVPIAPTPARPSASAMPTTFDLSTVIGKNWRCTQALRSFFIAAHGRSFRFNEALRTFIYTQSGRTLGDALAHYRESLKEQQRPIAPQFEYNNFVREYFASNPNGSMNDAIARWKDLRAQPKHHT